MPDNEGTGGRSARRIRKQNNNKLRPFEESCSETVVPRSGEPKQLDQTEVLVKHALTGLLALVLVLEVNAKRLLRFGTAGAGTAGNAASVTREHVPTGNMNVNAGHPAAAPDP